MKALNCLWHVPGAALPAVLQNIRNLLRPAGLFFLGVYGGFEEEGIYEKDYHVPPRFFSHHSDEFMQQVTAPYFDLVSFKVIEAPGRNMHFSVYNAAAQGIDSTSFIRLYLLHQSK